MRRILVLAALGVMAVAFVEVSQAQTDKSGFVSLFNGKDLTGWKPYRCQASDWTARDGVLRTEGGANGWLMTEGEYADFVLRLDYRVFARSNSGICLRSPMEGDPAFTGMEMQVVDDDAFGKEKAQYLTGSIYGAVPRTKAAARAVGEWNQLEIVMRGAQLRVTQNGVVIVDANLSSYSADRVKGLHRPRGHLGLQSHTGAVEYRNIQLRSAGQSPRAAQDSVGKKATVEFTVKGTGTNPAGWFELYSTPTWKDEGAFFVRLGAAAQGAFKKNGELGPQFKERDVQVTGVVKALDFTGVGKRYAIEVDSAEQVVVIPNAPTVATTPTESPTTSRPQLVVDARGHTGTVTKVLFTPDGKSLVSVSNDKTIRIWDVATAQPLHTLHVPANNFGASGKLTAAAINADGSLLAVGGIDRQVYVISLTTRKIERVLEEHDGSVNDLQFASNGSILAVACQDGRAHFYNATTGRRNGYTRGFGSPATGVAVAPDLQSLVLAVGNKGGRVLATKDFSVLAEVAAEETYTTSVCWRPDGGAFATGAGDGCVRIWNADGTQKKTHRDLIGKNVSSVTYAPDGKSLVYTSNSVSGVSGAIRIDAETGKELARDPKVYNSMNTAAFSPDGKLVASSGFTSEITLWRADTGDLVARLLPVGRSVWSAGWSKDGTTIAWGNRNYGNDRMRLHDYGELERTWSAADLQFGTPGASFVRAVLSLNGVWGERVDTTQFAFKNSSETLGIVDTSRFNNIWFRSAALLPNERVLLGLNNGAIGMIGLKEVKGEPLSRHFYDHADTVWAVSPSPHGRYFLSGSNDRTLKIWSFASPAPLLTLFVAGTEWVAWTPEGYYAASPGGENLVGWKTSNGAEQLATYHPAAQFHKTFYRPDIIKKLLTAGSVEKALALADAQRGQKSVATEVAKVLPPTVAITFPEKSGQKIETTKFEVKTSAASVGTQPVTSLRLLVDGRPYGGDASLRTVRSAKVGEVRDSWQVDLPPGPHRLAVVAASAVSQSVSDEIEIFVSPSTTTKPPTANLHLLAVGINAYPGRLKLDCAVPDAKAITSAFTNHSKGLYQVKSTLLLDKEATRANLLKGIATLEKQAKAGDVVIVYYAGHGDCKLAGQFVMLTIDATVSRDKLAQTGVTGDEVKARLARLPCTVLLIMDCCYAGSFDAPAKDAGKKKRSLPTEAGDLVRELVNDDHGLVVMCGASKEQESGEEAKLGHGYFTQSLIEGLGGKAASKRDGVVYLTGLQLYVEERVRELSSDEQYPTIGKPTLIRSFPLSKP